MSIYRAVLKYFWIPQFYASFDFVTGNFFIKMYGMKSNLNLILWTELESQLSAAETRCDLLEKQLEYMKNMVSNSERDRIEALKKSAELETWQEPPVEHSSGFQDNLRKIADLEREHIKLTANQSLAEVRI